MRLILQEDLHADQQWASASWLAKVDAFESLVATLLRRDGYWIWPSFKVELTKEEKRAIGRHSSPRWEIDLVAYKGVANEVLAVECKSFLDSRGVVFRNNCFEPTKTYKLFCDEILREVVLARLGKQLHASGACASKPRVVLCLAAGNIARVADRDGMARHFMSQGWRLMDEEWVRKQLSGASSAGYENDTAFVVAKMLLRQKGVAP